MTTDSCSSSGSHGGALCPAVAPSLLAGIPSACPPPAQVYHLALPDFEVVVRGADAARFSLVDEMSGAVLLFVRRGSVRADVAHLLASCSRWGGCRDVLLGALVATCAEE